MDGVTVAKACTSKRASIIRSIGLLHNDHTHLGLYTHAAKPHRKSCHVSVTDGWMKAKLESKLASSLLYSDADLIYTASRCDI